MRFIVLMSAAWLCAGGVALAQPETFASRAMQCLNLSPQEIVLDATAEVRVDIGVGGRIEVIEVLDYQPDNSVGREIALKSARAIEMCGPYPGFESATILIGPGAPIDDQGPVILMPAR